MMSCQKFCSVSFALIVYIAGGHTLAAETIKISKQPLDHAELKLDRLSKSEPFHIQLFDVTYADLGKPKHRDTAEMLARSAPHLLAVDIVEALREAGFGNVVLDEQPDHSSTSHLVLRGQFTKLDPGCQATRAWIGFGAGESKVCVSARIENEAGEIQGKFSHCRKGLGWGKSDSQVESSTERVGDSIAQFLSAWADGEFVQ